VVDVVTEHLAHDRLDLLQRLPGSSWQSTTISQCAGMTFRFLDAEIIVGANVGEQRRSALRQSRVASRALDDGSDGRHISKRGLQERGDRLNGCRVGRDPLDRRAVLTSASRRRSRHRRAPSARAQ
jgi:hypothetical protein